MKLFSKESCDSDIFSFMQQNRHSIDNCQITKKQAINGIVSCLLVRVNGQQNA